MSSVTAMQDRLCGCKWLPSSSLPPSPSGPGFFSLPWLPLMAPSLQPSPLPLPPPFRLLTGQHADSPARSQGLEPSPPVLLLCYH